MYLLGEINDVKLMFVIQNNPVIKWDVPVMPTDPLSRFIRFWGVRVGGIAAQRCAPDKETEKVISTPFYLVLGLGEYVVWNI